MITLLACVLTSTTLWADREPPDPVDPVEHDGVRYTAILEIEYGGVAAWSVETAQKLWEVEVFRVVFDEKVEGCAQEVYITSLRIEDDALMVTNEREEVFEVDLEKRTVRPVNAYIEEAYLCQEDRDCVTTCAQGAVNREWYEVERAKLVGCDDGCANQEADRPRCIGGTCVAFDEDGTQRPSCTRRMIEYRY